MSVEGFGLPADREALMRRHFGSNWSISEGPEEVTIHGWLVDSGRSTEVMLRGSKSKAYAVLWKLLQALER